MYWMMSVLGINSCRATELASLEIIQGKWMKADTSGQL